MSLSDFLDVALAVSDLSDILRSDDDDTANDLSSSPRD